MNEKAKTISVCGNIKVYKVICYGDYIYSIDREKINGLDKIHICKIGKNNFMVDNEYIRLFISGGCCLALLCIGDNEYYISSNVDIKDSDGNTIFKCNLEEENNNLNKNNNGYNIIFNCVFNILKSIILSPVYILYNIFIYILKIFNNK